MGIEPTSSAWKADILADVLYPQLQKELYHNFPQMSSMNLGSKVYPLSLLTTFAASSPKGTP